MSEIVKGHENCVCTMQGVNHRQYIGGGGWGGEGCFAEAVVSLLLTPLPIEFAIVSLRWGLSLVLLFKHLPKEDMAIKKEKSVYSTQHNPIQSHSS